VTSLYREPETPGEHVDWGALEFLDVFRIHRSGPVETVALRGLDLRVERGEVIAVLGPSGSGKSTLLQLAAGLDQPSAGEVRALSEPLSRLGERELAEYRARRVAIVFQSRNLWPQLTARENVRLASRFVPGALQADEALAAFDVEKRASVRAGSLSGGEQQRVAIAAAAARRAPLVLADEPTAELDTANERVVLEALWALRDEHGSTVVVVTHSARIASTADRVVHLQDGRVA
jgi:putative ABC transport system ATP-binding protein